MVGENPRPVEEFSGLVLRGEEIIKKKIAAKPLYHVVSFSGGKDSTAMLLHMVELGMPIDEIIFCDTGLEFPAMYEHVDKVEKYIGRKITRLKAGKSFEYLAFERPVPNRDPKYGDTKGLGWATPWNRWCTGELKDQPRRKYYKALSEKHSLIHYVGISANESNRLQRPRNRQADQRHPLVDWGWGEKDCLEYCKAHGFDWNGLYELFDRVSCWCCPLQSLHDLRSLYHNFPQLWSKLKEWDKRGHMSFKPDYTTVADLERRFAREDELDSMQTKINMEEEE